MKLRTMSGNVKFSSLHGQNIILSDKSRTATWEPRDSGAWACSTLPLEAGQIMVVRLEGSCHCELGFIKDDPKVTNMAKPVFQQMNEIRIHKRSCTVTTALDMSGTEITSRFQDKVFTKTLESTARPWVTVYIKFGDVSIQLLRNGSTENTIQFSEYHGANIELRDNNKLAKTIYRNPASLCFVKEKMTIGEKLVLRCSPVLDGSKEPSRCHVKIQVYNKNPESLKKDFKHLFEATFPYSSDPPIRTLQILEKEDCRGEVAVAVINPTTVGYWSASGKYKEHSISRGVTEGLWLLLELFRTSVSILKVDNQPATDQVDALVREPSNELAENTMDPADDSFHRTEPKRCASDYSFVVGAQRESEKDVQKICKSYQADSSSVHVPIPISVSPNAENCSNGDREINFRRNFTKLISDLNCRPLCDKLFEREIISRIEYEEILLEKTLTDANRLLLRTMMRKHIKKSLMDQLLKEIEQTYLQALF